MTENFDPTDTICAISTPPGIGGIAVARISGPQAIAIAQSRWKGKSLLEAASHTAHLGTVTDTRGEDLDEAVATVYRSPRSFTGEDVVEISVHGSKYVQRELLDTLIQAGARLAEPGEFTRRSFIAGKMDLAEAEAVADVIASNSRAAHRIAVNQMKGGFSRRLEALRARLVDIAALLELELDFSEEDVEFASRSQLRDLASRLHDEITRLHRSFTAGNAIKEGIPVAITGPTNAGKSSLLNALLGDDRAIVSDIHGTTRDTVEGTLEIGDFLFRFIDTAGLRDTTDAIERIGIERSHRAIADARIVIALADITAPINTEALRAAATPSAAPPHLIIALNKSDLNASASTESAARSFARSLPCPAPVITISATTGKGLDELRQTILNAAEADRGNADEDILVTNARHRQALAQAAASSARLLQGLQTDLPGDLLAQDLRETIHHLSAITGAVSTPEILQTVFTRFCIGK